MNTRRIEKWVWVLIYVGMFMVAIGLATRAGDASLGWLLGCVGAASITVGIVLIWLRSRIKTDPR